MKYTSLKTIYEKIKNEVDGAIYYSNQKEELIKWTVNEEITIYVDIHHIRINKGTKKILEYQTNQDYNEIYRILLECNHDFKKKESLLDKIKNKIKKRGI